MPFTEPVENDEVIPGTSRLSNAELDQKLEDAVIQNLESEKLVCCYLTEVRDRRAYGDFGCSSIYDYAAERFGFKERKTRYLVSLGRKLKELPRLREALRSGKIGWCKATRIASVASREDEAMWLDSALALSVQELDRRIKDGTDELSSTVHFWLTNDQRVIWENALELCRRVSGAEISPGEALEYMAAEFIGTWAHLLDPETKKEDREEKAAAPATVEAEATPNAAASAELALRLEDSAREGGGESLVCPNVDSDAVSPFDYSETRKFVLERDGYRCTYPGCRARAQLHVHHLTYRSRGGGHHPSNLTVVCHYHHLLLHRKQIDVRGRAPLDLDWTPPKLMQQVLGRRRNRPAYWVGELEVREWPYRSPAAIGLPAASL